jgi:flagellar hook-length control protein FliK
MVAGEQQSASLTLNPPDLGPLQVVLNVTNSHADATFVAAQPEVRQALEAAMPRLRDMLSDAGIQLGQATVSSGSSGQQSGFDQQQSSSGARRMNVTTTQIDAPMQTTGRVQSSVSGQGLVDTFV